jgi:NADH pyrophosphatase NudC (nudix superfamily)
MIYTLTLNPAIDYVLQVENLTVGKIHKTDAAEICFGGKGINVSKVLGELQVPSVALGLVAGFVGAGESLEDAVKRELAEEVGIKVENITYEGSQPWPFPNSLMVGFSARWQSGTVTPDGQEIVEAGFFAPSEFPLIPGHGSIARKLIDKFVMANNGNTLNTEK